MQAQAGAGLRDQQGETDQVGDKAGNNEQHAGNRQADAVENLPLRRRAGREFAVGQQRRLDPLPPDDGGADEGGEDTEGRITYRAGRWFRPL